MRNNKTVFRIIGIALTLSMMALLVPQGINDLPPPAALLTPDTARQETAGPTLPGAIRVLTVSGAITPITAEFIIESLEDAAAAGSIYYE